MPFYPDAQLSTGDPKLQQVVAWVYRQLNRLAGQQNQQNFLVLAETNAEIDKPSDGMMVYADGTNWNPGSGRGFYRYESSTTSWISLG